MVKIAIDGPAGSGKSTVSKIIADKLGILYLDTGAMYRVVTYVSIRHNLSDEDLVKLTGSIEISFQRDNKTQKVFYNFMGEFVDATEHIRSIEVSKKVPLISKIPEIRSIMTEKQRDIAKLNSVVMDGRDIGTVVLPDADFKFFITAKPEVRAKRRYDELISKGTETSYQDVLDEVIKRDMEDSNRDIASLKMADDAVLIDTSDMSLDDVVETIIEKVQHRKIKIYIADNAGFCFGVESAVKLANETAKKYRNVHTLGPIIHNPQLVKKMELNGIHVKKNTKDIIKDETIVIRSHGVSKSDVKNLENSGAQIVDATCPFVSRAHWEAEKLSKEGYFLVIFGEKEHPEVRGIVSYSVGDFVVVENEEDAKNLLPHSGRIGLIAQTTQNRLVFKEIAKILGKKCDELKVVDTICNATTHRQESAKKIASQVDIMFVIGGKNSGNTTRLYEICKNICTKTFHIETKDEIDKEQLIGVKRAGITAGASTPQYLIVEVIAFLKEVDDAGKEWDKQ